VPPLIATCCAAAAGDVKLTDVGASVTTAGPPLTVMLTVAVRLGFDASALVSTQAPALAGVGNDFAPGQPSVALCGYRLTRYPIHSGRSPTFR
jgi:hypothetical protein